LDIGLLADDEQCSKVLQKANTSLIRDLDAEAALDHMYAKQLLTSVALRDIQVI